MRKEQLLNIYEDNGLYGAKDQNGQIVITAQYTEMYQFSCGLSLVRNSQYQYAYIDYDNNIVIPFGVYYGHENEMYNVGSNLKEVECL